MTQCPNGQVALTGQTARQNDSKVWDASLCKGASAGPDEIRSNVFLTRPTPCFRHHSEPSGSDSLAWRKRSCGKYAATITAATARDDNATNKVSPRNCMGPDFRQNITKRHARKSGDNSIQSFAAHTLSRTIQRFNPRAGCTGRGFKLVCAHFYSGAA